MNYSLFSRILIFLICFCDLFFCPSGQFIACAAEREKVNQAGCVVILLKDQEYFPALTKAIDDAEKEIIMSFFLFKAGIHSNSYPDILYAHLAKSVQKGVKVIVLLENTGGRDPVLDNKNRQTKQILEAKGMKVYLDSPRKTTHTKLVIIDERLVLLGSHNLTNSALKYNNEVSVLINKPNLAKEARHYILKIIKEAK